MADMRIGFSSCPNDTFIFDALLHKKIDTEGINFEPVIEDVEALNRRAFEGDIEITKLSYHAFAHLTHRYRLLDAGSALGRNCGPLVVSRPGFNIDQLNDASIAIPGKLTTANFLLGIAFPKAQNKTALLFSDIEDAVINGAMDAGLIIHENRFTYEQRGLIRLADLGEIWDQMTGLPIPLGGIVVNRSLPEDLQRKINKIMRRSVEYAFEHTAEVMPFVRQHAQAMDDDVMKAHIGLYVTPFTVSLGEEGRQAVNRMFEMALERGLVVKMATDYFVA